ncbi:MAG: hypothetical protein MUC35_02330 [Candidatus Margulisbacteria bacterium]|jgi:hypothetical protein|nr:hypothetical protein [Candidatus Margulisiibacteriota bacterium]
MNNWIKQLLLVLTLANGLFWPAVALAAEKSPAEPGTLTKGEAVMMLSATDFMKHKIGELLSWTVGYDVSKVNRVRLTPIINYVKALPKKAPPDGRTVVELIASVDDPGGLINIAGVRADLSEIGRQANTMLVDNGLFGDAQASDGVFTLQTSISPKTGLGAKDIPVAVANKKGWLALTKTTLDVKRNPTILEARFQPDRALADGKTLVTITVKVDNPGRIDDIAGVAVDLRQLQLGDRTGLGNKGADGDATAGDNYWSLQFTLPAAVPAGTYVIPIQATNLIGGLGVGQATLTVTK